MSSPRCRSCCSRRRHQNGEGRSADSDASRAPRAALVARWFEVGEVGIVGLDDADDDAEDAERRGEDLDDEDFDEERRVLGVAERARGAGDADRDARGDVGEADREARREERVAGEVPLVVVPVRRQEPRDLGLVADLAQQQDGEDDAVDGGRFAKDDRDEVLRPNARRLDGGPDERRAREPHAPRGADDAQAEPEGDAHVPPAEGGEVGEDLVVRGVAVLGGARCVPHGAPARRRSAAHAS
mmetsp:Transcript_16854/g.68008  ORF Transcript_16854/g.68008 Transcript_16854/m.68008 type:complete len:242 (-) Transcript_16854:36-761(-)